MNAFLPATGGGAAGPSAYEIAQIERAKLGLPRQMQLEWLESIRAAAEPWTFDPAHLDWEADYPFPARSGVRHGGSLWLALQPSQSTEPGTDDDVWRQIIPGVDAEVGPVVDERIAALTDGAPVGRDTLKKLSDAIDGQKADGEAAALARSTAAPTQVIAHRGLPRLAPENTMAAFAACHALGVRQIECDVQPTLDGAVIALHDDRLERTTNGCGYPYEWTLDRLRQLSAALPAQTKRTVRFSDRYPYDEIGRPTCVIPTWDEILTYSNGRFDRVWAEIKGGGWDQGKVHALVNGILARKLEHLVVLQSYYLDYLQWVREVTDLIAVELSTGSPDLSVAPEYDDDAPEPVAPDLVRPFADAATRAMIAPVAALGGERYLLVPWRSPIGDATLVRDIRASGTDVVAYTVDVTGTLARATVALRRAGVSLIMTDTWLEVS